MKYTTASIVEKIRYIMKRSGLVLCKEDFFLLDARKGNVSGPYKREDAHFMCAQINKSLPLAQFFGAVKVTGPFYVIDNTGRTLE